VAFDRDACAKVEATLKKCLTNELDFAVNSHPLLAKTRRSLDRASRITTDADVRNDASVVATYDVPGFGFGVEYRLDSSITTLDRLIPLTAHYALAVARAYKRDLRSRLYKSRQGFLGLEGLVPPIVGDNVIGGSDEAIYPGWQSKAATNTLGIRETLDTLDAVCSTEDGEPDLTEPQPSGFRVETYTRLLPSGDHEGSTFTAASRKIAFGIPFGNGFIRIAERWLS
jgi:hypothetical protein